tara:strand:+ start:571 stop:861 length:291 start_codon:yes stop_codon:yes gene_type:complete
MTTLIIAEKPSVARDIARVIGATMKKQGYLEGSGYKVTWCFGHLGEQSSVKEHLVKLRMYAVLLAYGLVGRLCEQMRRKHPSARISATSHDVYLHA